MSSKECRIIQERAPHCQVHEFTESPGLAQPPWCAYKMRLVSVDKIGPSCYADRTLRGGLTADPGTTSSQPRRSRSAPPSPGGGARSAVPQRPPLLPRPGQGPGQLRDAARAPGRRRARGQGGQRPRLLSSGLPPRRRGLRGGGHEEPARREARTPRSAQGHARDPRVRTLRPATLRGRPLQGGGRAVRRGATSPHPGAPAEDVMRFWPAIDPVQLDYERLREMALAGTLLVGPQAERFQTRWPDGLDQEADLQRTSSHRQVGGGATPTLVSLRRSPAGGSGRCLRPARGCGSGSEPDLEGASNVRVATYARVSSESQEARGTGREG